jgi:hypothetical protein
MISGSSTHSFCKLVVEYSLLDDCVAVFTDASLAQSFVIAISAISNKPHQRQYVYLLLFFILSKYPESIVSRLSQLSNCWNSKLSLRLSTLSSS